MRANYRVAMVLCAAAIVIAGCASLESASRASRPAPLGFRWGGREELVHVASRAVFERNYAEFLRGDKVVNYDRQARDVSVEYFWPSRQVLATLYVYPTNRGEAAGEALDTEYRKCRKEVHDFKTVNSVVAESTIRAPHPAVAQPGYLGAFSLEERIGGRDVEFLSFLYLFGKDDWYVLFRVSLPIALADDATLEQIRRLPEMFDYGAIE